MTVSGGLLRYIRIFGTLLLPLAWMVWIVCKVLQRDSAEHISGVVGGLPFVLMMASWIAPPDLRGSRISLALVGILAVVWLICVLKYATTDYRNSTFSGIGIFLGISILFWLSNRGYRRWKAIESPVTRVFTATALITTVTILVGGSVLYFLARLARSAPNVEGNWMVTALILYLPLMGLIAFGYDRWRKRKNGK